MEIGFGARVRDLGGRRYLYLWHYEREGGRSVRKEDYMGRADDERARQEVLRRIDVLHDRANREFAKRRARIERVLAGLGSDRTPA